MEDTSIFSVYAECASAIRKGVLIAQVSKTDKEYHFQNWVENRLIASGFNYDIGGRNSYPDFRLVKPTEGYEVKGLAYPGREANFDSNSQIPTGFHNGRTIFYVFGRYPSDKKGKENEYPVVDLVICHGDLLNADHDYVHKNKGVKGFGSYGDIMIRDRKMYVVPTPFAVADGLTGLCTLILPENYVAPKEFKKVGEVIRTETENLVVAYEFDLVTNGLKAKTIRNENAGKEHRFVAYRLIDESDKPVSVSKKPVQLEIDDGDE